jgi:iron complex transport system permease protein
VALTLALGTWGGAQLPVDIQWVGPWAWRLGLTGAAFAGAWGAVLLTLLLARGVQHTLRLLLAGVVVGVVSGAATQLVLLFSPESLQAMQSFMLGSTAFAGWAACGLMGAVWLLGVAIACALGRALDGLSLGETTARSLGLPVATIRMALVGVLAIATGTAVAQTGLIAFVGLAAPHLVRSVLSTGYRWLIVLASLMGAVLLMAADVLARGVIAPQELPVGVVTAVLGGAYLLWLMHRNTVAQRAA